MDLIYLMMNQVSSVNYSGSVLTTGLKFMAYEIALQT